MDAMKQTANQHTRDGVRHRNTQRDVAVVDGKIKIK